MFVFSLNWDALENLCILQTLIQQEGENSDEGEMRKQRSPDVGQSDGRALASQVQSAGSVTLR